MRILLEIPDQVAKKLDQVVQELHELDCADDQEILTHILEQGIAAVSDEA